LFTFCHYIYGYSLFVTSLPMYGYPYYIRYISTAQISCISIMRIAMHTYLTISRACCICIGSLCFCIVMQHRLGSNTNSHAYCVCIGSLCFCIVMQHCLGSNTNSHAYCVCIGSLCEPNTH